MSAHGLRRRQVLSATGTAIVGGLLATGSAAADNHLQTYRAELTGEELDITTAASGTATVTVDASEKDGSYEVTVDCLRNGTHVSVSLDGGETVTEVELEGDVTEGLVRNATIAEGTLRDLDLDGTPPGQIQSAAKRGDLVVTVHTEQHPGGEIAGAFDAVSPGEGKPDDGDDSDETYTLSVSTVDVETAGAIPAEVTVDGETQSTSTDGADEVAAFELPNGTYRVSAVSDQETWDYVGSRGIAIDGADESVTVTLSPDYPELDHVEHGVDLVEVDDGVEAFVASGRIENNTETPSPGFLVELELLDDNYEEVATVTSTEGHLGLQVDPGESIEWKTEPLRADADRFANADFDAVNTGNYNLMLRGGAEGHFFSSLTVRGGEANPMNTRIAVTDAETGEPIEGATVEISSADVNPDDMQRFTFTTNAEGRVVENVEVGNFNLVINAEGYEKHTAEVGLEHEYHAELQPIEEDPDDEHTLTINVTDVTTGEPIESGEIVLTSQDADDGRTETLIIEDGVASGEIPAGEYDFDYEVEGYTAPAAVAPPGVDLTEDTELDAGLFGGFELVTLSGQVLDAESDEPIEGAEVTGFGTSPTYDPLFSGTTDANGNVELDIENTRWQIDVTADGYERLQTSVDYSGAEEGETFEETFELQPADDGGDDTDDSESSASLTTLTTDFVSSLLL